jgi:fumarylpyruvate hydrolase
MSHYSNMHPSAAIAGTTARFPVHRIYCVGRNYGAHVREMGNDPKAEPPVFFMKPADAVVDTGAAVPYPPRTSDFHHEVELVVAIGDGGADIAAADALAHVFGYAVGNDLTRRDLQNELKAHGRPWDVSKGFDHSAPVAPIRRAEPHGHVTRGRIWLSVNGEQRQSADITDMIWTVPQIVAELSSFFRLEPGDLIFTGTPAGVGPLKRGDRVECGIDGLETLRNVIE